MILFFFHIPKTAGSSITIKAQSTLSRAYTVLIHNPDAGRLPARLVRLSSYREMYFVQGHVSPTPEFFSIPMKRVTVLRQPLQRLISHFCYSYDRRFYDLRQLEFFRRRKNYAGARFDGDDLVAWVEKFKMDDFQVRFLSGHFDVPMTEESETRALQTLRSLDFVATMDNLRELFTVLGAITGKDFTVERVPHNNKTDKNCLTVSRADLEFFESSYCKRDNRIVEAIGEHRAAMFENCVNSVLERVGTERPRELARILGLMLSNVTVNETLFRLKRKSIVLTTRGMDFMRNIVW